LNQPDHQGRSPEHQDTGREMLEAGGVHNLCGWRIHPGSAERLAGPRITSQMSAPVRYAAPTNNDLEVIDNLIVGQLV
jgi:hypothetical protein